MKVDQIDILCIFADPLLDLRSFLIDDTQVHLIVCRRAEQNLIYKTHFFLRAELFHTVVDKVLQYRCIIGTDCHNHILR